MKQEVNFILFIDFENSSSYDIEQLENKESVTP